MTADYLLDIERPVETCEKHVDDQRKTDEPLSRREHSHRYEQGGDDEDVYGNPSDVGEPERKADHIAKVDQPVALRIHDEQSTDEEEFAVRSVGRLIGRC